jgi:DNA helicase HerA-like ATPase
MAQEDPAILVGKGTLPVSLLLRYGNRHGMIAGATGSGKTVTLQVLAEGFSRAGVPVFLADVKGDLSGISQAGQMNDKIAERIKTIGITDYKNQASPVIFWDLFGEQGHPIRATVSEMCPLLLYRLLYLNDTQEGVLNIAFKLADDQGLLLLDFKDLRAILEHVGENASEIKSEYGNVSTSSVGAVQRQLLILEQQGGSNFFGEPALRLPDIMRTTQDGRGYVSVLAADKLMQSPQLYATFLLWLLSELFEELPEVGDPEKPRLVFFFDEAHLLFDNAPKALIDKVEQVVRLIRSKGVGVYFISQNPLDVPDNVLTQLGNRVQHALRAFTPRDQKAVRTAADTFRANPDLDTATAITELAVGEALVSMLEAKGVPAVVQKTLICPPQGRMGPITPAERTAIINTSPVSGQYDTVLDRESACEILAKKAAAATAGADASTDDKKAARMAPHSNRMGYTETIAKSVLRTLGSQLGRQIVRGVLGSIFKGR